MGPKAAVVVGTRPEAVKLAPVVVALREQGLISPVVVTTGQQREAVEEVLGLFGLAAQVGLAPVGRGWSVTRLTSHLLAELGGEVDGISPDLVVVQGDTASVLAGALAGFLRGVPVVHVEAGLRTGDLAAPFPEEGNRRMVSQIAALHLAPTAGAFANLHAAGVAQRRIVLTGNTVVDALRAVQAAACDTSGTAERRGRGGPRVLVTAHRRESWGEPIAQIGRAVARLADRHPDWEFAVVCHMNPAVRATLDAVIPPRGNVTVSGPVGYRAFVAMLADAAVVVTDSGGIQEEAPVLGVPVLVTRELTERPEALAAGAARLVGTDPQAIVAAVEAVVGGGAGHPATATSPFGDGHAGTRSAAACAWLLGLRPRPDDMPAPAAAAYQDLPSQPGGPTDAFLTASGRGFR